MLRATSYSSSLVGARGGSTPALNRPVRAALEEPRLPAACTAPGQAGPCPVAQVPPSAAAAGAPPAAADASPAAAQPDAVPRGRWASGSAGPPAAEASLGRLLLCCAGRSCTLSSRSCTLPFSMNTAGCASVRRPLPFASTSSTSRLNGPLSATSRSRCSRPPAPAARCSTAARAMRGSMSATFVSPRKSESRGSSLYSGPPHGGSRNSASPREGHELSSTPGSGASSRSCTGP
mmetsp:Transcript_4616/g.19672  ORF Transcript_4616/g.19672 Transcript_4616/m.19672 type:complete len:234 (-) Transcript_4616:964-1665(-)